MKGFRFFLFQDFGNLTHRKGQQGTQAFCEWLEAKVGGTAGGGWDEGIESDG